MKHFAFSVERGSVALSVSLLMIVSEIFGLFKSPIFTYHVPSLFNHVFGHNYFEKIVSSTFQLLMIFASFLCTF